MQWRQLNLLSGTFDNNIGVPVKTAIPTRTLCGSITRLCDILKKLWTWKTTCNFSKCDKQQHTISTIP